MKTLTSQIKNEFKLSNDYSVDSRAALGLCKSICIPTKNLSGFVQEISEYPFGLMLLNEIQVNDFFLNSFFNLNSFFIFIL